MQGLDGGVGQGRTRRLKVREPRGEIDEGEVKVGEGGAEGGEDAAAGLEFFSVFFQSVQFGWKEGRREVWGGAKAVVVRG